MKKDLKISKENRNEMIGIIKEYFDKERDEDLGDLAASMLLDFIASEIGPYFYNQGIEDSYKYLNDKMEDLLGLQK